MQEGDECNRDQGAEAGPEVVTQAFETEGLAAIPGVGGFRNHCVARGGAHPRSDTVDAARDEDQWPTRRKADDRLADCGDGVAGQGDPLAAAEPVREPAGKALNDILGSLSYSVDEADDGGADPERL